MSCCGKPLTQEESDAVSQMMADKLSAFLATLRDNAFVIGLKEAQDAALLLAHDLASRPARLRAAMKHLFSARKQDWERFDGLFDAFWLGKRVRSRSLVTGTTKPANSPSLKSMNEGSKAPGPGAVSDQVPSTDEAGSDDGPEGQMEGASSSDRLESTDFRKLSNPDEIAKAHAIAEDLAQAMRTRLTRRDHIRKTGYRLDLRRTIRNNLSHGGVPLTLAMRQRKEKPLKLVVLLDASGSMSLYTGVFLRFVHGVLDTFRQADAFLFNTRLAYISDAMRERDAARALDRLSLMVQGAGGGTKIGDSLATFNRHHAARVLHSRTCVMILSDGYETGDASQLGREMAALARRCRRIVWLNPMIRWDGYAPVAAGMQAAMPHLDLFAPAATLQDLRALEPYLAKL